MLLIVYSDINQFLKIQPFFLQFVLSEKNLKAVITAPITRNTVVMCSYRQLCNFYYVKYLRNCRYKHITIQ